MQGSPILRGALLALALLLLLIPMRALTVDRAAETALPEPTPEPSTQTVRLSLTSSAVPVHYQVRHLGQVIWEGDATIAQVETELPLAFPPDGIDLVVSAAWETDTPSAVELAVTPPDREPISRTLWGTHSAEEVLTFQP